jgi:3-hydroxybutyryl-CoA dehydrogenase
MGQGLAEAIAAAGHEVTIIDKTMKLAKAGIRGIGESMDREIGRWGLTDSDKKAILSRITPSSDSSEAEEAQIILDAIPDSLESKRGLLQELDQVCPPETIFITNTGGAGRVTGQEMDHGQ